MYFQTLLFQIHKHQVVGRFRDLSTGIRRTNAGPLEFEFADASLEYCMPPQLDKDGIASIG